MPAETPDPRRNGCPSRKLIAVLGDKWTLLVMPEMIDAPRRNAELLRSVEGISQKMLTQTLRRLETFGLVTRTVFDVVPPHTEYDLTPLGRELGLKLKSLDAWIAENWDALAPIIERAEPLTVSTNSRTM